MRCAVPLLALVLPLAGCADAGGTEVAQDATISISTTDSSSCWSANVGGATQDGCGSKDFPVHDATGIFASNVQKKAADGIEVQISVLIRGEVAATNSTSADYGIAQVLVDP